MLMMCAHRSLPESVAPLGDDKETRRGGDKERNFKLKIAK
jgi:hypothetical protein